MFFFSGCPSPISRHFQALSCSTSSSVEVFVHPKGGYAAHLAGISEAADAPIQLWSPATTARSVTPPSGSSQYGSSSGTEEPLPPLPLHRVLRMVGLLERSNTAPLAETTSIAETPKRTSVVRQTYTDDDDNEQNNANNGDRRVRAHDRSCSMKFPLRPTIPSPAIRPTDATPTPAYHSPLLLLSSRTVPFALGHTPLRVPARPASSFGGEGDSSDISLVDMSEPSISSRSTDSENKKMFEISLDKGVGDVEVAEGDGEITGGTVVHAERRLLSTRSSSSALRDARVPGGREVPGSFVDSDADVVMETCNSDVDENNHVALEMSSRRMELLGSSRGQLPPGTITDSEVETILEDGASAASAGTKVTSRSGRADGDTRATSGQLSLEMANALIASVVPLPATKPPNSLDKSSTPRNGNDDGESKTDSDGIGSLISSPRGIPAEWSAYVAARSQGGVDDGDDTSGLSDSSPQAIAARRSKVQGDVEDGGGRAPMGTVGAGGRSKPLAISAASALTADSQLETEGSVILPCAPSDNEKVTKMIRCWRELNYFRF